ncbi:hypothetical protein [Nakamurella aerolata]|uniref:KDO2-lipid IV(A) lauroyltransferase n=1 Tax=Nakamurella aerolata TaxID=1656892 RepID=A0A849A3N8_9ACTN|nr:hypothetical protein [Nakamurella aerolata]
MAHTSPESATAAEQVPASGSADAAVESATTPPLPSDAFPGADPALTRPRPVPNAGLLARLRDSDRVHALLPTPLALAATDLVYGLATRLLPGRRAAAENAMRAVLPPDTPAPEIARLARAQVRALARGWELYYRPKALQRIPIHGLDHLAEARASGRGIIISFVHYGPEMAWTILGRHAPIVAVNGDWVTEAVPDGFAGLQVEKKRSILRRNGFGIAYSGGSASVLLRALKAGGIIMLAMDLPGKRVTRYLGRDVEMVDGTARLAGLANALIVPGTALPRGRSWYLQLFPALDPADYPDTGALHQALADVHDAAVSGAPEHLNNPIRPGMWARATETAWLRT